MPPNVHLKEIFNTATCIENPKSHTMHYMQDSKEKTKTMLYK